MKSPTKSIEMSMEISQAQNDENRALVAEVPLELRFFCHGILLRFLGCCRLLKLKLVEWYGRALNIYVYIYNLNIYIIWIYIYNLNIYIIWIYIYMYICNLYIYIIWMYIYRKHLHMWLHMFDQRCNFGWSSGKIMGQWCNPKMRIYPKHTLLTVCDLEAVANLWMMSL